MNINKNDNATVYIDVENHYLNRVHYGTGEGVAVIINDAENRGHGIGDDILIMPALASVLEKESVTIYGKRFFADVWRALGCTFVPYENDTIMSHTFIGYDDKGERVVHRLLEKYARVYYLCSWSCWGYNRYGYSPRDLIAEGCWMLDTLPPKNFSWVNVFRKAGCLLNGADKYILYAPGSNAVWRSITKKWRTYIALRLKGKVVWLSAQHRWYTTVCSTAQDLIDTVYRSKHVVTCDTGILHIALSLGKDVTALFGFTDAHKVAGGYTRYIRSKFTALYAKQEGCEQPCNGHSTRGFTNGLCKGIYEKPLCQSEQSIFLMLKGI